MQTNWLKFGFLLNPTNYICICNQFKCNYIYIYTYIYIYIDIYIYIMYLYIYIYIYLYIYIHTYILPIYVYIYLYICMYLYVYVYTRIEKICQYLLLPPRKVPSIRAHTASNSQFTTPRFCSSLCYNWIMFVMNLKMLFSIPF